VVEVRRVLGLEGCLAGKFGNGTDVVESTEELAFGEGSTGIHGPSNGDTKDVGGAGKTLGAGDGIEDAPSDTVQVASGAEGLVGKLADRGDVLASTALEHPFNDEAAVGGFLKVNQGDAGADAVAGVGSGDGVDGVGAQGNGADRIPSGGQKQVMEIVSSDGQRQMHVEDGHARVLTERK
jgi:hypothetical protein